MYRSGEKVCLLIVLSKQKINSKLKFPSGFSDQQKQLYILMFLIRANYFKKFHFNITNWIQQRGKWNEWCTTKNNLISLRYVFTQISGSDAFHKTIYNLSRNLMAKNLLREKMETPCANNDFNLSSKRGFLLFAYWFSERFQCTLPIQNSSSKNNPDLNFHLKVRQKCIIYCYFWKKVRRYSWLKNFEN